MEVFGLRGQMVRGTKKNPEKMAHELNATPMDLPTLRMLTELLATRTRMVIRPELLLLAKAIQLPWLQNSMMDLATPSTRMEGKAIPILPGSASKL